MRPDEILYVSIQIQGENGVVESNDDRLLHISVEGGELLGFGSANPRTEESYVTGKFTTYYGYAQAVVRANDTQMMTITVQDGKKTASKQIRISREV